MSNGWLTPWKLALQTLQSNRSRTALTVFGVVIGIAMVIIVLSAGAGLRGIVYAEIASFGDNWINIEVKVPSAQKNSRDNASALGSGVSITTLTYEDAQAVVKLSNINNAYAGITSQATVSYLNEKLRPIIFGVTSNYIEIDKSEVKTGRFFSESEERSAAQVAVLGSQVAELLFGNAPAMGKKIKVDKRTYEVIGVMEERGATGFFNMDYLLYLPLQTVQKKMLGVDHVVWIVAQVADSSASEATAREIEWLLRDRHDLDGPDKDDFAVTTQEESIELVGTVIFGVTWLLIALAAISLLVGGVGIMNVMYVSVAERTFEIGLRKAVGATKRAILNQFLVESVVITLLGGIVGILIGSFISYVIAVLAQYLGYNWVFEVSFFSVALGTGFSMAVGVIFGLYPARKASQLDPIEAIRQE